MDCMFLFLLIFCINYHAYGMLSSKSISLTQKTALVQVQKRSFNKLEKQHIKQLLFVDNFNAYRLFIMSKQSVTHEGKAFLQENLIIKKKALAARLEKHNKLAKDLKINAALGITGGMLVFPSAGIFAMTTVYALFTPIMLIEGCYIMPFLLAGPGIAVTGGFTLLSLCATSGLKDAVDIINNNDYIPVQKYTLRKHCREIEQLTRQVNLLKIDNKQSSHIDTEC